jgi:hypothetical protein
VAAAANSPVDLGLPDRKPVEAAATHRTLAENPPALKTTTVQFGSESGDSEAARMAAAPADRRDETIAAATSPRNVALRLSIGPSDRETATESRVAPSLVESRAAMAAKPEVAMKLNAPATENGRSDDADSRRPKTEGPAADWANTNVATRSTPSTAAPRQPSQPTAVATASPARMEVAEVRALPQSPSSGAAADKVVRDASRPMIRLTIDGNRNVAATSLPPRGGLINTGVSSVPAKPSDRSSRVAVAFSGSNATAPAKRQDVAAVEIEPDMDMVMVSDEEPSRTAASPSAVLR